MVRPLPAQADGLENVPGGIDLLHRVGGEGHPEGVPDPQGQQAADAGGSLQRPHVGGARLGDPQVEGIVRLLVHQGIGPHGDGHRGGL